MGATFEVLEDNFLYDGHWHKKGEQFKSLSDNDTKTLNLLWKQVKIVARENVKPYQAASIKAEESPKIEEEDDTARERRHKRIYKRRDMRSEE